MGRDTVRWDEVRGVPKFFFGAAYAMLAATVIAAVVCLWGVQCDYDAAFEDYFFHRGLVGVTESDWMSVDGRYAYDEGLVTAEVLRNGKYADWDRLIWARLAAINPQQVGSEAYGLRTLVFTDSGEVKPGLTLHSLCADGKKPFRYCYDERRSAEVFAGRATPVKPQFVMPLWYWTSLAGGYALSGLLVFVGVLLMRRRHPEAQPVEVALLALLIIGAPFTAAGYGANYGLSRLAKARTRLAQKRQERRETRSAGGDVLALMRELEEEEKLAAAFPDKDISRVLVSRLQKVRENLKQTAASRKERAALTKKREAVEPLESRVADLEVRAAAIRDADKIV